MEDISSSVTNTTMLRKPHRVASLLMHPYGLRLLKQYKELKNTADDDIDIKFNKLASELTSAMMEKLDKPSSSQKKNKPKGGDSKKSNSDEEEEDQKVKLWQHSEPTITKRIREVLSDNPVFKDAKYAGEHEEKVDGENSQGCKQKGHPDIVMRFEFKAAKRKQAAGEMEEAENQEVTAAVTKGAAVMITEASVDENGGEKKVAQAYEYARLQGDAPRNQVLLIVWLHFDRKRNKKLRVTQETWLFVGDKKATEKAQVGFLWREDYESSDSHDVEDSNGVKATIKKAFVAYIRSLACSQILAEDKEKWEKQMDAHIWSEGTKHKWQVVSDNVAIETCPDGNAYVYKIFDNRQHQTWQKSGVWLTNATDAPWLENLGVREELKFEEKEGVMADYLGRPIDRNRAYLCKEKNGLNSNAETVGDDAVEEEGGMAVVGHGGAKANRKREQRSAQTEFASPSKKSRPDDPQPRLIYPLGSVQVIRYNFLKGTHVASKLSHFLTIAEQIQQMHVKNYVHGDIRNWNMLHPIMGADGKPIEEGESIQKSQLIDFDFSGKAGTCQYPPGFSERVPDNVQLRVGRPGLRIEKLHDWKELGSAMGKYYVDLQEKVNERIKSLAGASSLSASAVADVLKMQTDCQDELFELRMAMYAGDIECPVVAIQNFIEKWGDCTLSISRDETRTWDEATKGTNSPNKAQRSAKSTRNSVGESY